MKLVYATMAKEQIRDLPPEIKKNIKRALELLENAPYSGKPLQRELEGFWTLRVGWYRIIYDFASPIHLRVYSVEHRRSVYENLAKPPKSAK